MDDDQTVNTAENEPAQVEEVDREQMESNVREKLNEVFGDEYDDIEDSSETETPEDSDDDEVDDSEEETAETEDSAEEDDDSGDVEDEPSGDSPAIPESYRRSLRAYGWQDNEIDSNLRNLGDSFLKTAERLHQNHTSELQRMAQTGQQTRESQESGESEQSASGSIPSKLDPVDADKLKEQYGEDELIDAIVSPVNATISSLNAILPQLERGQQTAQQAEIEKVGQEVERFFSQDEISQYEDFYGNADNGLSEEQLNHRNKVLDQAYNLMVGAQQMQGQPIPMQDALTYAHEIVASDVKETRARNNVKKEAKKRNKGITTKPSRRGQESDSGSSDTRRDLERKTRERLQNVFG